MVKLFVQKLQRIEVMKKNLLTAVIISVLSILLIITLGSTLLLMGGDKFWPEFNSSTDTEGAEDEEITLPPPMELADERHLSFILTKDDKAYTVVGLFSDTGAINIVIPETYNGLPVIGIENNAFASSSELVSLTMPDTIKYIGQAAFEGCTNLENLNLSPNLEYIGEYAFDGCDSLDFTEYDNAFYLGDEEDPYTILMYAKDTDIESCNVHKDTRIIYSGAFYECADLNEISIPDTIKQIGIGAFDECYDLFPNPNEDDPDYKYTKSAHYIGNEDNPYLILVEARDKRNVTSIEIHPDTQIIAPGAFFECEKLESINIPDSLCVIGEYAFEGCTSLEAVSINSDSSWRVYDPEAVYNNLLVSANVYTDFTKSLVQAYYYCAWIKH